jgi:two-component sensor histidine kinase
MGVGKQSRTVDGGQGRRLETLVHSLREGFVLCRMVRDRSGRVIDYVIADANDAYLKSLGGRSVIGKSLLQIRPEISQDWFQVCAAILASGKPKRLEYWDPHVRRWFDANMTPVSEDELVMLYVDITHRKTAEAQAKERLNELNHRVKNNLTLVAGMLALQARSASPETRLALEQAAARVHTISEVHNLLHKASSIDSVSLDQYLQDLCRKLERSLAGDGVSIHLEADRLDVSIEQAVELGVIVNELLTNAIKYAYPRGAKGEIKVTSHAGEGRLELAVRDSGPGIPANSSGGLGMKLVRSIVRQNGGEVSIRSRDGAEVRIRIPLHAAGPSQPRLV